MTNQLNRVIEALELEVTRSHDDVKNLKRDSLVHLKQRNIFLIAKCLYFNLTQLNLDCEIWKGLHKIILPFLELKEE